MMLVPGSLYKLVAVVAGTVAVVAVDCCCCNFFVPYCYHILQDSPELLVGNGFGSSVVVYIARCCEN